MMKMKLFISGKIAVIRINHAIKKDILPKNSHKLYMAVKLAGMKDRIKTKSKA